jgi:hypothetical protein
MPRKVRPQTSVKQILARDLNWRIGNLRRQYFALTCLDKDLCDKAQQQIILQQEREIERHKKRLEALVTEDAPSDTILRDRVFWAAVNEAERNRRDVEASRND